MAQSARLVLVGLVVPASRTHRRKRVTLETEQVHSADAQHSWIGGAMWTVAALASLGLHRDVFINEWPLLVGVALVANLISTGQSANLTQGGSTVRVVTVAALDECFIDTMVIGLAEICTSRGVTAVAEVRLFLDQ